MQKFKITIPSYNCEQWIAKCIRSVTSQINTNWEAVIINDGSTDKTGEIASSFSDSRIKVITNEVNVGSPLASIIQATQALNCEPEDIIVNLDGDDELSDPYVLEYLSNSYDSNTLMTYGQFEPMSHTYHNYCKPITNAYTYRKSGYWYASHLRTYKKKLFDKIRDEDLRDTNGEYYKLAGDAALLYPLIELAGVDRMKFITRVMYNYNDLSELNEMKKDPTNQIATANRIRQKPEYLRGNF